MRFRGQESLGGNMSPNHAGEAKGVCRLGCAKQTAGQRQLLWLAKSPESARLALILAQGIPSVFF